MSFRRRSRAALVIASIILSAVSSRADAVTYYLVLDVPSTLGGADYTPDQVVRSDNAAYALATTLPGGIQLGAIHRRSNGLWLLAPAHAVNLGGTEFEPRDVFSYDGTSFAMFVDGSAVGVPDYARIDALFIDTTGDVILSFDVPVNLGGVEYSRSDLVRFSGGAFSLFWNAAAAGVPAYANVVGADKDSLGALVVSFDVPTNMGGIEFLPGQLVRWNNPGFVSYFSDVTWPPSAQLRDFSFVPAPGAVPDGGSFPGVPLTVSASGGQLSLSWGTSCARTETDYEIYEGTLGSYYSHTQKFCTTGGATTKAFPQPAGSTYYLVVPKNADREGSYGRTSGGTEIPQGASACLPQQIALACP